MEARWQKKKERRTEGNSLEARRRIREHSHHVTAHPVPGHANSRISPARSEERVDVEHAGTIAGRVICTNREIGKAKRGCWLRRVPGAGTRERRRALVIHGKPPEVGRVSWQRACLARGCRQGGVEGRRWCR